MLLLKIIILILKILTLPYFIGILSLGFYSFRKKKSFLILKIII